METSLKKILKLVILLLAIVSIFVGRTQSTRHSSAHDKHISSQKYPTYAGSINDLHRSSQPYPSYPEYHPANWCCNIVISLCCNI
jgi:hypothetical protein